MFKRVLTIFHVLGLGVFLLIEPSSAQGLLGQAEGSRPGQTYIKGEADPADKRNVPVDAPPAAGAATMNAPVIPPGSRGKPAVAQRPVIMEFSDLQCPDSARFNVGLKNTIMQRYVNTGQAEFRWYDFPLPSHDQSISAAIAARCAGPAAEQVRRKIMANQGTMTAAAYAQYAREAGINMEQYSACIRGNQSQQSVMADKALGQSYGVRGTPTLVLAVTDAGGRIRPVKVVKGYDPPQQVLAQIDAFLAEVKAPQVRQ